MRFVGVMWYAVLSAMILSVTPNVRTSQFILIMELYMFALRSKGYRAHIKLSCDDKCCLLDTFNEMSSHNCRNCIKTKYLNFISSNR